jgi:hypothetical protein
LPDVPLVDGAPPLLAPASIAAAFAPPSSSCWARASSRLAAAWRAGTRTGLLSCLQQRATVRQ